jgi:hypothetical protein
MRTATRKLKVIGRTGDGVPLLAPATKPTHFTWSQIRKTIRDLRDQKLISDWHGSTLRAPPKQ